MFLWDVLFPRRCFGCGWLGSYVCLDCSRKLKMVKSQTCLYCGRESLLGLTHPACRRRKGLDGRISLYYYDGRMKKIIAGIKYRLVRSALPDLAYLVGSGGNSLTEVVRKLGFSAVIPIPLSRARKNERGFNQAEYISRIITALLPLSLKDVLLRDKNTPPQATLSGNALRHKNVKGAFSVRAGVPPPARVLLVDDVITTGETVREAARVLKEAGAEKVYALSVAKG